MRGCSVLRADPLSRGVERHGLCVLWPVWRGRGGGALSGLSSERSPWCRPRAPTTFQLILIYILLSFLEACLHRERVCKCQLRVAPPPRSPRSPCSPHPPPPAARSDYRALAPHSPYLSVGLLFSKLTRFHSHNSIRVYGKAISASYDVT